MKSILDEIPADAVPTPRSVARYLALSGWDLRSSEDASEVWTLREGANRRAQVFLPLDKTYVDFPERFDTALRRLCLLYDCNPFQLASNVMRARSDLLYIRADQEILHDSIPLKQAEQLIQGTAKMMSAAAWSTLDKRASYSGRRPRVVRHFVEDEVRMGHTQRGSFVITVISRLDEEQSPHEESEDFESSFEILHEEAAAPHAEDQIELPDARAVDFQPFSRRVMSTLATSLQTTADLIHRKELANLDSAVDLGVNAMLCDSLYEMSQFAGIRAIDLNFKWAPASPEEHPNVDQVVFTRESISYVKSLGDQLKERSSYERLTIYGRVTKLERADDSHSPDAALVTIRGVLDQKRERLFRMRLTGHNHELAIRAYRDNFPLLVTGSIDRTKRSLEVQGDITVRTING